MVKVLSFRFQQCLVSLTRFLFSPEMGVIRHWSNFLFGVRNFGNTPVMRVTFFFWKCSEFNLYFKFSEKNSEKYYCFWDNCIWIGCVKLSLLRTEYLPSALNVLTKSLQILNITSRDFLKTQLSSQWSIHMVKFLSFRFQQCLDPFTMLVFEWSSEMGLVRHWSKLFLVVRNFGNTSAMRVIYFCEIIENLN